MRSVYIERKTIVFTIGAILAAVVATIGQDFLRANIRDSGFYFSESLLFTSFWWLFLPFLWVQQIVQTKFAKNSIPFVLLGFAVLVGLHLLCFPILVWVISGLFYDHTFAVLQTFRYALSEHLYQLIAIYPTAFFAFRFVQARNTQETTLETSAKSLLQCVLVSKGQKKQFVNITDITYFSANPPYVMIHVGLQSYFHNESLKSFMTKLDPRQFVRIHKSAIVNLGMVESFTIKRSGDGEIIMKNGNRLRLSRNFASDFKTALHGRHGLHQKILTLPHQS